MLTPSVKLIAGAFARDRAIDTTLGSLGVSAALISASFAGYMMTVGPKADARGGGSAVIAVSAPSHLPLAGGAPPPVRAAADAIDFNPTGSVAEPDDASPRKEDPNAVLTDFAVRDVFDGTALIEAHGSLHMITPGATLAGVGEVLAIERKGAGWIVKTAGGVIRQRR